MARNLIRMRPSHSIGAAPRWLRRATHRGTSGGNGRPCYGAEPSAGAPMPELPEVETVRRSLAPYVEGARIETVTLNRKDLRTPFPRGFAKALEGQTIERIDRRAKYLLFRLSSGKTWIAHLGMTGSFRFRGITLDKQSRYFEPVIDEKHDHVVVALTHPQARQAHDDLCRRPPLRDDEPDRQRRDERRDRRSRARSRSPTVQRRRDGRRASATRRRRSRPRCSTSAWSRGSAISMCRRRSTAPTSGRRSRRRSWC